MIYSTETSANSSSHFHSELLSKFQNGGTMRYDSSCCWDVMFVGCNDQMQCTTQTEQKNTALILPFKNNTNVWGLQFTLINRLKTLTADKIRQKRLPSLQIPLRHVLFRGRKEYDYGHHLIQYNWQDSNTSLEARRLDQKPCQPLL